MLSCFSSFLNCITIAALSIFSLKQFGNILKESVNFVLFEVLFWIGHSLTISCLQNCKSVLNTKVFQLPAYIWKRFGLYFILNFVKQIWPVWFERCSWNKFKNWLIFNLLFFWLSLILSHNIFYFVTKREVWLVIKSGSTLMSLQCRVPSQSV